MYSLKTNVFCHLQINLGISFSTYRTIAEWLDAYDYVLPAERAVMPEIGVALAIAFNGNIPEAYHTFRDIECNIKLPAQQEILSWINQYNLLTSGFNNSPIPADSHCIPAQESTNSTN
jgi:hypothetical protein